MQLYGFFFKIWENFFKKTTVKFFNFWYRGATFFEYVFKNRPQIRFFRPKIRVVRWHGEGFELFFESVNTLVLISLIGKISFPTPDLEHEINKIIRKTKSIIFISFQRNVE